MSFFASISPIYGESAGLVQQLIALTDTNPTVKGLNLKLVQSLLKQQVVGMLGLVAFAICAASVVKSAQVFPAADDDRIINGWESGIDQAPWEVSLQKKGRINHFCGGTIIDKYWVLTAAHCVNGRNWRYIRITMGHQKLSRAYYHRCTQQTMNSNSVSKGFDPVYGLTSNDYI